MNKTIAVIAGDGIGPEIVAQARKVLDKVCEKYGHSFTYTDVLMGGCSIDANGVPLTDETIEICRKSDAVLMGSIGGDAATSPWYRLAPELRPEAGLAFGGEEGGDVAPLAPDDGRVEIDEGAAERVREPFSERGLSGCRSAVQKEGVHIAFQSLRCSRACAASMERPFSTRHPAARARAMSGVSAGA